MPNPEFDELEIKIVAIPTSSRAAKGSTQPAQPEVTLDLAEDVQGSEDRDLGLVHKRPCQLVKPGNGQEYLVEARSSRGGTASGQFRIPFEAEELDRLLKTGPRLTKEVLHGLGLRLFQAVFRDNIGNLFATSNQEATRNGRVLRFRLRVTPPELAEYPWEILRPTDWVIIPARCDRHPLVREVELLADHQKLLVEGPLRVLLVSAGPRDQRKLDLEREIDLIVGELSQLSRNGKIEVKPLRQARKSALEDELRSGKYHVVHFMMHGDFDGSLGRGVLMLENEAGQGQVIEAEELASYFYANPQSATRVVIFNACRTAADAVTAPGSGVAAALVRLNVPAVVAMRYPISDPAAITFAREFYHRLIQGLGVDQAVSRARHAIRFELEPSFQNEWMTPVLYLQSRESQLFDGLSLENRLEYTAEAGTAKRLSRQLEGAIQPEPGKDHHAVTLKVRRDGSADHRFAIELVTPHGSAVGSMDLTPDYLAPLVPCEDWPGLGTPTEMREFAADLFTRLFPGDLARLFREARQQAGARGMKFCLLGDDAALDRVPWEYVRDPYSGLSLAAGGGRFPFLRQISELPTPVPDPIDPPLRLLFISCKPRDLPPLQIEREWNWLQEAVHDAPEGTIEVDHLQDPTVPCIHRALNAKAYHVLHFAGYDALAFTIGCASKNPAEWVKRAGPNQALDSLRMDEGFVLLNDDARMKCVYCDDLADLLCGFDSLRLVVSNTCFTAAQLAPMLVRSGIPAVVGMRFALSDDVAVRFTLLFYKALLKFDHAVDAAVAETRKILKIEMQEPNYSGHWAYPTLITSVPGADVFGRGQRATT